MCGTPAKWSMLYLFCIPPLIVRAFEDVRWHICRDWATGDIWGVEVYLRPKSERAVSPAQRHSLKVGPQESRGPHDVYEVLQAFAQSRYLHLLREDCPARP